MKFKDAVGTLLRKLGSDYILDSRFVYALADLNAFEDEPAQKNLLRMLVMDGYTQKLYNIGCWNEKAKMLMTEIVRLYGFDTQLVSGVLKSIAEELELSKICIKGETKVSMPVEDNLSKSNSSLLKRVPEIPIESHFSFMGIPISGTATSFIESLKAKGFAALNGQKEQEGKGCIGKFSKYNRARVFCADAVDIAEIYRVIIVPVSIGGTNSAQNDYEDLKFILSKKYGQPKQIKGIGIEFDPIRLNLHSKTLLAFGTLNGSVVLGISGYYGACLIYEDGSNYEKVQEVKKRKDEELKELHKNHYFRPEDEDDF